MTREEITTMLNDRNDGADFERGKLHAANVLRTLGLTAARHDALVLSGSYAPKAYVRGFWAVVSEAANRVPRPQLRRAS